MAAAYDSMQGMLVSAVQWLRLAIEAVGALWIAVGFAFALAQLTSAHVHGRTATFTAIRLTFSRYLSLALEFQLASDILSTSIAPSWAELGKLGTTAVIRTALNYFLAREMREYEEKQQLREEAEIATRAEGHFRISPSAND